MGDTYSLHAFVISDDLEAEDICNVQSPEEGHYLVAPLRMGLKGVNDHPFSSSTIAKRKDVKILLKPGVDLKSCLSTLQGSSLEEGSVISKFRYQSLLLSSVVFSEAVYISAISPLSLEHDLLGSVHNVVEGFLIEGILGSLDCISGYDARFLIISRNSPVQKDIHRDHRRPCLAVAICKSCL